MENALFLFGFGIGVLICYRGNVAMLERNWNGLLGIALGIAVMYVSGAEVLHP